MIADVVGAIITKEDLDQLEQPFGQDDGPSRRGAVTVNEEVDTDTDRLKFLG